MARHLPDTVSGRTAAAQVTRSGCSVAANDRAALRGKSRADVINKITIVLEEADETLFWIEFISDTGFLPQARLDALRTDAEELVKIFNATRTTARTRNSPSPNHRS